MSLHTGIPITGYTEVELGDGSITLMGTGEKHGIHGVVGPQDVEPLLAPKDLIMINVEEKVPPDDEKELLFPNLDIPKPIGRVCVKYMRPIDVAKAMDKVVAASDCHEKDRLREILMKGSYATHKNDVGTVDPKYTHTIKGQVPERQAQHSGWNRHPDEIVISDRDIGRNPSQGRWSLLTFTNQSLTKSAR